MPRLVEAMKDVLGCEKPRGAAKKLWSGDIRMGQPGISWGMSLLLGERTQGSETSQYLEEKKSNEIPKVAASEMGEGHIVIAHLLAK